MADEEKPTLKEVKEVMVQRIFEQPADAISFHCDLGQVFHTGNDVVMQFYETIPGAPDSQGNIKIVRTRLKATIYFNIQHARNLGNLLVQKTKEVEK